MSSTTLPSHPVSWLVERTWTVLLVGGNAGSGKTTAARDIALALGVPLTHIDDVRLALQAATTAQSHPDLHVFAGDPNVWERSSRDLLECFLAVGRAVGDALAPVIAHHAYNDLPLILEGDGLLPSFAAQGAYDGYPTDRVRAVFLVEPDEAVLRQRAVDRGRGFAARSPAAQAAEVRLSATFATWLSHEARRHELAVLPSQPADTTVRRLLATVE